MITEMPDSKIPFVSDMQCTVCGRTYALDALRYTCPDCGQAGTLDIRYDFERLRASITHAQIAQSRDFTMWRYRPLLPVAPADLIPPLPVGWTPLVEAPRLAGAVGVAEVWIKDDGRNPTGSLKDRASAMVVARALHMGVQVVTTASTGNAAAALAGVSASVGLKSVIFVPANAPEAKIAQLLVYGATVFLVQGSYDDAFDLCMQAAEQYGWYCRNTGINPFTTEGKKTVSFEVAEQLDWHVPDVVIVSVGDGSIISGVYKGFTDLFALGWINHVPRLIGVQAEGSAWLHAAWQSGSRGVETQPIQAHTLADSIASDLPHDRVKALRAVRQSHGAFVTVTDDQILAAIPEMAQSSGVFAEPASAATLAGLRKALATGIIYPTARVVLISTGNGLKDIRGAMRSVGKGITVGKTLDDIRAAVIDLGIPSS